jgi:succinoglycan biosynthesis transport protein ExoP
MNLPDAYRGPESSAPTPSMLAFQAAGTGSGDRFAFAELFAIFRRRLLAFSCIVGICFLLSLIITQLMPPTYISSADVLLSSEPASVAPNKEPTDPSDTLRKDDAVETELQLIDSRELARKTIDKLRLLDDASYREQVLNPPSLTSNALRLVTLGLWNPTTPQVSEAALRDRAITLLQRAVDPQRLGSSYAIRINVSDSDPARARRIADALAGLYVNESVAVAAAANKTALDLVRGRLEELRVAATADTNAVQMFRIRNNLLSNQATALTESEIAQYDQAVATARAEASEDAARLSSARQQLRAGKAGAGVQSPVITALRAQRAQLSEQVAGLSGRYLDSHPQLVLARSQLRDIDTQIDAELSRTIASLQSEASASAERLSSLSSSRGDARGQLASNNQALVGLTDLENRARASSQLYQSYLDRFNQLVAKHGTEQPAARQISGAVQPGKPASPSWGLNLLLGLLVGVLLGIFAAVAIELSYSGLTTREDVEGRVGLRFLSAVPDFRSVNPHGDTATATIQAYPGGAYAEAMFQALTSMRQAPSSRGQVIAFTSALPGEGKSTVAASFAHALALQHDSVLLVDCDFIRRELSKRLAPDRRGAGLQELLGGTSIADGIAKLSNGPSLLAVTTPFAKGARLMEDGRLHRLIAKLREEYDFIILDCPPILPIAEVREMVTLADHVAIVVRWRSTADRVVRAAVKLLPLNRLGDVGIILNGLDMRKRVRFGGDDVAGVYGKYSAYYT